VNVVIAVSSLMIRPCGKVRRYRSCDADARGCSSPAGDSSGADDAAKEFLSDRGRGVRSSGRGKSTNGKGTTIMKLTTLTMVTVDGVMQGLGGADEDRRGGFERGGWVAPMWDAEGGAFLNQVYARADAFLFGRHTYDIFAGSWGTSDVALDLVESRSTPKGVMIQTYRVAGRPRYEPASPDMTRE
jgi:hypothetical protein